jgi:hypothetical protein
VAAGVAVVTTLLLLMILLSGHLAQVAAWATAFMADGNVADR